MNTLRYFSIVLLFFSCISTHGQNWSVLWDKQWETSKNNYFTDVIEDKNDGFAILGSVYSSGNNSFDLWLIRLSENGDTIWTKKFGTELKEIPKRLTQHSDGGYLLSGVTDKSGTGKIFLVRTDNLGLEIWNKTFEDEFFYTVEDVISLGAEGFFVAGSKGTEINNGKLWLAKLDEMGEINWEKQFENDFTGSCKSIKKLPDGGFSVAGKISKPKLKDSDMWVMRTNDKGEPLWQTKIPSPGLLVWPECVCCSPDSCFMVAGWQGTCLNDINSEDPIFDYDLQIVKLDCKGKVLWTKNFDREGSEGGNAVVIRPDGNFVVAGVKATSFLGKVGPWLMLVDPDGNLISEKLIDFHFNNDQIVKVINSTDGGIIVIGPGIQEESRNKISGWMMKMEFQ